MKRCCKLYLSILLMTFVVLSSNAYSQIFGAETANQNNVDNNNSTPSSTDSQGWLANPRRAPARPSTQQPAATVQTPTNSQRNANTQQRNNTAQAPAVQEQPDILDIPQTERPTLDGVTRGHVSMQPIIEDEEQDKEDRFIFIYYSDFTMRTTMSGKVLCDVRFIVLSTLDRKINNVSFRLKWPKLETPLSFSDVTPNVETYMDYTLIGDGCYSMDKAPNIIVNRCRVRDMSQKECAEKIRWLRKTSR